MLVIAGCTLSALALCGSAAAQTATPKRPLPADPMAGMSMDHMHMDHTVMSHGATPPDSGAKRMDHAMAGMAMDPGMHMHHHGGGDVLAASSPADGQGFVDAPGAIALTFKQPVQLESLQVFESSGARAPVAAPSRQAMAVVRVLLPHLPADTYEIRWRTSSGGDGVAAQGSIRFTVN